MNKYGFSDLEQTFIQNILNKHFHNIKDATIYLFGSRAKGSHRKYSDVDLIIDAQSNDLDLKISNFIEEWENSNLPYKLDLIKYKDLYSPYKLEIEKTKTLYWENGRGDRI